MSDDFSSAQQEQILGLLRRELRSAHDAALDAGVAPDALARTIEDRCRRLRAMAPEPDHSVD